MKRYQFFSKLLLLLFLLCFGYAGLGQTKPSQFAHETFRGTRIVNGHSVELLKSGELEMVIGHRFGRLNGGAYELFGLDQAEIRIGFDYGIQDWLTIGAGRSSLGKEFDGFLKVRLLRQAAPGFSGWPVSVTGFASVTYNSLKASDPERPLSIQNRLAYTYQLFIARKLSDRFALQVMPTLVHKNLVKNLNESNDILVMGASGKYQLSKNWALTSEYYYVLPGQLESNRKNTFSIGVDLNTGSHVFQLHFTNTSGMNEKQFITETTGDWLNGDIQFGFNMVRTFKLKGRRY